VRQYHSGLDYSKMPSLLDQLVANWPLAILEKLPTFRLKLKEKIHAKIFEAKLINCFHIVDVCQFYSALNYSKHTSLLA
jgi:hypothetical protein